MDKELSVLQRSMLGRRLARNNDRIRRLESMLKGIPIATVRFADGTIINAKIDSLSASKILSGTIGVGVEIIINDGTTDRILISHNEIRISKPGVDVTQTLTEFNKKDFVIISTVDAHKIVQADFFTSGTYTHGLGKVPFYHLFEVDSVSSPTYFRAIVSEVTDTQILTGYAGNFYVVVFNEGAF